MAEENKNRYINLNSLTMYRPNKDNTFVSRLTFGTRNGQLRVAVNVGDPDKEWQQNMASIALSPVGLDMVLDTLGKAIAGPAEQKYKVEHYWPVRDKNTKKLTGEQTLGTTCVVGKNKEGLIWIALLSDNIPNVPFIFGLPDWNKFYHPDGSMITEEECSVRVAKSYIRVLRSAIPTLTTLHGFFDTDDPYQAVMKPQAPPNKGSTADVGLNEFDI